MKEEVKAPKCGRENDLIAFLYGELSDVESRTFQRHAHDCVACSKELAAFRNVRESVVAWRNESLGWIASPARAADSAITSISYGRPSALAALREFFNLSPLWLKGAVAFASVLFCLLAVLAIARLQNKPSAPVVNNSGKQQYSEEQLKAIVEERLKVERERIRNPQEQTPPVPVPAVLANRNPGRHSPRGSNDVARRPLSKTEREQLAADLRLISGKNDTELDLLDDRINQ